MYNKIQLMGRLVAAPELKTSKSGVVYTQFRIAVNRRFHSKGEESQVDFFNIIAWRGTAEFICKYFGKGNMIMLDGELQTEQYEDRNGNPATWYSVSVDNVSFTGEPKIERGGNRNGGGYNNSRYGNSNRSGYNGGNKFEQSQQLYGQPPANNGYGNGGGQPYPNEPPNGNYPF